MNILIINKNKYVFIFVFLNLFLNNNFLSLIQSQNFDSKSRSRTDIFNENKDIIDLNENKKENIINIGNDSEDKRNLIGKSFDATLNFGYKIYLNIRNYFIKILARTILFSKDVFIKMKDYMNVLKDNAKNSAIKAVEVTKVKAIEIDEWAKENSK